MAETIPSQITFSKLLSHTFPGIFTTIGIFMLIYLLFANDFNRDFSVNQIFESWTIFIGVFGGIVFFGTIIGVIIDSFHHMIEQYIIVNIIEKIVNSIKKELHPNDEIKNDDEKVLKDLNNNQVSGFYYMGFLPLERFKYLTDNYYSYIECELNLSISFFFSAFIYSYFAYMCRCTLLSIEIIFIILIFFYIYCFISGTKHFLDFKKHRIDFIKGAMEHPEFFK